MKNPVRISLLAALFAALTQTAAAHSPEDNRVRIEMKGDQRCIISNGMPNHAIGDFPNSGNPHSIEEQENRFCFSANPKKNATPTDFNHQTVAIALNGIPIRPGTAESYDPHSRRGFSRHGDHRWRLEGIGNSDDFGMDMNNAHVDHRGYYHYHGVPKGLIKTSKGSHIGYGADGFEIHWIGDKARSGWKLKRGERPSGPGGAHDGTYVEDWEYRPAAGDLDQCNGGMLNGKFVYFVTATYPFWPRCIWGTPSSDFMREGRGHGGRRGPGGPRGRRGPPQGHFGDPPLDRFGYPPR